MKYVGDIAGKERSGSLSRWSSVGATSAAGSLDANSRSASLEAISPVASLEPEVAGLAASLRPSGVTGVASSKHSRSSLLLHFPGDDDEGKAPVTCLLCYLHAIHCTSKQCKHGRSWV